MVWGGQVTQKGSWGQKFPQGWPLLGHLVHAGVQGPGSPSQEAGLQLHSWTPPVVSVNSKLLEKDPQPPASQLRQLDDRLILACLGQSVLAPQLPHPGNSRPRPGP